MNEPPLSDLQPLNEMAIPGDPNPSTRWRWITNGVNGIGGEKIKLQCWYLANRPFTTLDALSVFMRKCTAAQAQKTLKTKKRKDSKC